MYANVLIATDGSPGTERAVGHGLAFADAFDADVHALYVVDTRENGRLPDDLAEEVVTAAEKHGRGATATVEEQAADLGLSVTRAIREGVPSEVVVEYAREHDVDLVVLGSHGDRIPAHPWLGSTTANVLRTADVPVLSARVDGNVDPTAGVTLYDDVLVPTDGSDESLVAVDHAIAVAERSGATLHAVYVVDESVYDLTDSPRSIKGPLTEAGERATDAVADLAAEADVPVTTTVLTGAPSEELLDYAGGSDIDLITMGAHGESGAATALLGSTTERVVRDAAQPVLTVR
ncbi:universal stress protein [Halobacteriaceae archaeon GCM10025711]